MGTSSPPLEQPSLVPSPFRSKYPQRAFVLITFFYCSCLRLLPIKCHLQVPELFIFFESESILDENERRGLFFFFCFIGDSRIKHVLLQIAFLEAQVRTLCWVCTGGKMHLGLSRPCSEPGTPCSGRSPRQAEGGGCF